MHFLIVICGALFLPSTKSLGPQDKEIFNSMLSFAHEMSVRACVCFIPVLMCAVCLKEFRLTYGCEDMLDLTIVPPLI